MAINAKDKLAKLPQARREAIEARTEQLIDETRTMKTPIDMTDAELAEWAETIDDCIYAATGDTIRRELERESRAIAAEQSRRKEGQCPTKP